MTPTGPSDDRRPLLVARLGEVAYARARRLQSELVPAISRRAAPETLLLLSHPHTYTIGRGGSRDHLLADAATLARLDALALDVDRGGDITYHGPGQLVGYPLLRVETFQRDIHGYLRRLEATLIGVLADLGIAATRSPGYTGVWVGDEKVAAIGVKLAQHVTWHGFALNLATDMEYWSQIVPCGLHDRGVTSVDRLLGHTVDPDLVADRLVRRFAAEFGLWPIEADVITAPATDDRSGISLRATEAWAVPTIRAATDAVAANSVA